MLLMLWWGDTGLMVSTAVTRRVGASSSSDAPTKGYQMMMFHDQ